MSRFKLSAIIVGLALVLGAPVAPARAQAPSEAADIAFWESIRNSRDPAEVRAYLDKFPNGLFGELARIRLKRMEGASAAPAPEPQPEARGAPLPPPSPTHESSSAPTVDLLASALVSESIIREVQERLYNLNYTVPKRDGQLSNETRDAIRAWQRNVKRPETGDMTFAQLLLLRRAKPPTNWGAMAYYTRGATSTVWNQPTRAAAEQVTLSGCRKSAKAACNVIGVPDGTCAALGFYTTVVGSQRHYGAYAFVRRTLPMAQEAALAECRRNSRRPSACTIRTTVCADGSHQPPKK